MVPGRYAVRRLGGGRRYEAYLAWDDDLHALVAVKMVRPGLVGDDAALRGLAGEAAALGALAHPALVRAFGHDLSGPRPHLVLEYLDGPRLSTFIRREVVSTEQVLQLMLELSAALHHIGRRGWVHLDVKPRNVIMAGPPRLIDLSVARTAAEARATDGPIGTAAYMAPEQCDPALWPVIGPPADVWGLGVSVHELLDGRHPFDGSGDGEVRYPQLAREPALLPRRVPTVLAAVVRACMERRPQDRPTAAEVHAALQPVVDDLPRPRLGLFRPGTRSALRRMR